MGKTRLCLAFFKENKIHYYFDEVDIKFPCFYCKNEALMDTNSTEWFCIGCSKRGTLSDLIDFAKNDHSLTHLQDLRVFNPTEEYKEIRRLFRLMISHPDLRTTQKLQTTFSRTEKLMERMKLER